MTDKKQVDRIEQALIRGYREQAAPAPTDAWRERLMAEVRRQPRFIFSWADEEKDDDDRLLWRMAWGLAAAALLILTIGLIGFQDWLDPFSGLWIKDSMDVASVVITL